MKVFEEEDAGCAKAVEPLEEVIDQLSEQLKMRHIKRLRAGTCTIELGFILADLTANFDRRSLLQYCCMFNSDCKERDGGAWIPGNRKA